MSTAEQSARRYMRALRNAILVSLLTAVAGGYFVGSLADALTEHPQTQTAEARQ
jgi:hypothetical protein